MTPCCKEFAENFGERNKGFEFDYGWHVNGCCGGGCYVLVDLKFCPYCGTKLEEPQEEQEKPT